MGVLNTFKEVGIGKAIEYRWEEVKDCILIIHP